MLHTQIETDHLTYAREPAQLRAEDVMRAHAPMVRRVAWHVHSRMSTAIEIEDLIQIGLTALVEAARTFEDRGISFGPYASVRVRGAMIDELRRDARMARAGMAKRREIAAMRTRLEHKLLRPASDAELAEEMGLAPEEYFSAVASTLAMRQESLDDVYSDHDAWFADGGMAADAQIEAAQSTAHLERCIATLPEREALILQLYFVEEMNLDEIGATLGIGAARVCQIKKSSLEKLRSLINRE